MDFFQRQQAARRSTFLLSCYFAAAVILITVAVNAAVYFAFSAGGFVKTGLNVMSHSDIGTTLDRPLWIWTTAGTLLIIGCGSLFSFVRLSGGGRSVARMMDARLVDLNTNDPREKRLINVVEEMSIASGTPVPELYIQDGELGINAFVAGYHIREAVLVVTEGTLANLNRDELQGVVGHEFSHILNGDMRINVRLIAILAGIILLSQLGGYMLRGSRYARSSRNAQGTTAVLSAGAIMFVMGYIGLFFGRLIKAAISRQREYLADAASVQFTRNPDGIAGALYKIKLHSGGSVLQHAHAEDMSHMCFGETVKYKFTGLFATHPPIDDRIDAIHPRFDPSSIDTSSGEESLRAEPDNSDSTQSAQPSPEAMMGAVITAQVLMDSVGTTTPDHVDYARSIQTGISDQVRDSIHQPLGARAVIYSLVLAGASIEDFKRAQVIVHEDDGEETARAMSAVLADVRKLGPNSRLPLVELSFPALGRLHRDQKDQFVQTLERVIRSDNRYTLFEFALLTLIRKHLNIDAEFIVDREYNSLSQVAQPLASLLSLFARLGADDDDKRRALFTNAMQSFGLADQIPEPVASGPQNLSASLAHLDHLSPLLKRPVLNACADCIVADGRVEANELELLRATCAALDCPMPPLLVDEAAA